MGRKFWSKFQEKVTENGEEKHPKNKMAENFPEHWLDSNPYI